MKKVVRNVNNVVALNAVKQMNQTEVQQMLVDRAINSLDEHGRLRVTIEAITGLGKTFISFHLIRLLKPKSVLFLAETTMREQNIEEDMAKYRELFGYNIRSHHKVSFLCYQSAYKKVGLYHDMVVADEIHDALTPQYFKYYNNNRYTHLLGLSATIDKKTSYTDEVGNEYTKLDMLNTIAPICATYSIKDGQVDNTARKLKIIIVDHELDNKTKNIEIKYKDKAGKAQVFYQTEYEAYTYANARYKQALFSGSQFTIRYWGNRRNNLLYGLRSKTQQIIKLLSMYNLDRTIVFGNNIDELCNICPTVSSKNTLAVNKHLIEEFNKGNINTIGSFKMLKQGVNLKGLNYVIFHSYYSKEKDFIQRVGRLRQSNQTGVVFLFVTKNTQEETWLNKMLETLDLQYIRINNITQYVPVSTS